MRKNVFAAALIAPAIAFAPAAAMAHYCKGYHHHHHHHHAKADQGAYGSGKSMKSDKTGGENTGSQDMNKNLDRNPDTNRSTGGGASY